jgi:hypothetical protein
VTKGPGPARSVALAACVSLLLASCRSAPPSPGLGVLLPADDPRPQALLQSLAERRGAPSALRGAAKLRLESEDLRFSRPQRIVVERPAKLRVEVLGLFGQVAGIVATDGVRFGFIDLAAGRHETGWVDDGLLWRTARVDLTPAETVFLVLGSPDLDPAAQVLDARARADGTISMRLRGSDGARERRVEVDAAGRLRRIELRGEDGELIWIARYSDFREVRGRSFAHEVRLDFPRVDARATLYFQAVELDPTLSPDLFVLQIPAGV